MSGQDERRPPRHLSLVLDEDGAACLQLADDVRVVDDLLADVDRRTVQGKRSLHRLHGALHSGAIPPGRGEQDPLNQTASHGSNDSVEPC